MIPTDEIKNRKLIELIFSTVSNEIQVLEPTRSGEKIIDFTCMLPSKPVPDAAIIPSLSSSNNKITEASLFSKLRAVMETGHPLEEVFSFGEEDSANWCRIKAEKFRDHLIVSREDLSSVKQAEARLMQLNRALFAKNRELETLSSELKTFNTIAANDYNDTLRNLYTSMEFLISNDASKLSDPGRANVRRAQASIQKLKLLTEDIVAFSRISTDEPVTVVDLNEILSIVINSMQRKIQDNEAVINYKDLPQVNGYPLLLTILFSHLIDNALKFRKPDLKPVIDIDFSVVKGNSVQHSSAIQDIKYTVISVNDNGLGFEKQESEKIFTMFYRVHEKGKLKGSGIGLAICKKIMDLHNGFIVSECNPNCTTFMCYFPLDKN